MIKLYFNLYNQSKLIELVVATTAMEPTATATELWKAMDATPLPTGSELWKMPLDELVVHIRLAVMEIVNAYPNDEQTEDDIILLMTGVAKLSAYQHQGLGAILYAHWLHPDNSDNIMAKIEEPYSQLYTNEDLIEKGGLESILWLKLAMMCNVEEAIQTYADMLSSNSEWIHVPVSAIRYMDNLIKIDNYRNVYGATQLHEFVIIGIWLVAYMYSIHKPACKTTRTYKLYVELTHAISKGTIPHGLIHGYDGDATTTDEMADLLVNLLEGGQY